ncbi:MAG: EAL domain-containing protein [Gammaproteobacteria bacterium]|nr:EAL domain-containing protein [Gammaproteobacteria bacterium]
MQKVSRRALWEAVTISVATLVVVWTGLVGLSFAFRRTVEHDFRHHLVNLARMAAVEVDPVAHAELRNPGQLNGALYRRAVAPLRRLRKAVPEIHYLYTVVRDGSKVRFVLDAADPRIDRMRGVNDQSGVWQEYDGYDPAMQAALGDGVHRGVAGATEQPARDAWGRFMTGWAPLVDAAGHQYGALGVDVDANLYLARLRRARDEALLGIAPAGALVLLVAFAYYRVRRRGLQDAQAALDHAEAAARTAETLAMERTRTRAIVEATDVGTWEKDLSSGVMTVSDHWAAMLGQTARDLNPLKDARWREMIHPDDLPAVLRAFEQAAAASEGPTAQEFRMRHSGGHWVWVLARAKHMERDPEGRPLRLAGIQMDVSARKHAELSLKESEARFRSLFELSPVGITLADMRTGRFLQVNDAMLASSGYEREELLSRSFHDITAPKYAAQDATQLATLIETGRYGPYEKEYLRKDGSTYAVSLSGISMRDAAGHRVVWSIVEDISARKTLESQLMDAARRDKLTGLANRARFMESLENAVARARRDEQASFAVLFLDFDRFKMINDTLGHRAGDELLRQIAGRLRKALRGRDSIGSAGPRNLVGRFGGDEFLVLLEDLRGPDDAPAIAERLLNVLLPPYRISGRDVHSTASIGIVTSAQRYEDAEDILRNADVAMYEAKRAGRACCVVFDEAMHVRLSRHLTIETGLRRAIGTDELSLVYQPIVDLSSGRVVSVEALTRWHHPQLGAISPNEFIPIAEESDLIVALGHWVLRTACAALRDWREADPAAAPRTVSVNVSQAELALGTRLVERIAATLEETGLPPQCLQLEVTEREVMRDPDACLQLMGDLRRLGVRLAMDDFGTGMSSLGVLRNYPFDTVKIDRSFVHGLTGSQDVLAVIHATVNLVENLGMASLAEGVEERAQVAVLQSLGCRFAQGFLFSPPVPATALLAACRRLSGVAPVRETATGAAV